MCLNPGSEGDPRKTKGPPIVGSELSDENLAGSSLTPVGFQIHDLFFLKRLL